MLRLLLNDLKRGLGSGSFWLGLLICLGVYGISQGAYGWYAVYYGNAEWVHRHNMFMTEFNPYKTLLPLAAALPLCAAPAEDWEHHSHFLCLNRASFASYCTARFLAASILGGLVLAVGLFSFLGVMAAFCPPFDESTYREEFIEPLLQGRKWALYFAYYGSLQFLLGALCAGIGCVTAALTPRRGMIYLCPMLLPAMLEIVAGVAIVGLSGGQSSIVFNQQRQTPGYMYALMAGILGTLTAAAYLLFRCLLKRRAYLWQ